MSKKAYQLGHFFVKIIFVTAPTMDRIFENFAKNIIEEKILLQNDCDQNIVKAGLFF